MVDVFINSNSSLTLKQSQTLESIQRRACKIMLGFEYVSYVNVLEICDLDLLSARHETHCLNFARSLLKSERTKMLIPPADRRFMANCLKIAPTSPNYMRALTDSLKAPYPTTLACLIPPSLPSWWLLRCPHLWCGYWISLLFASAYFFAAYILYYFCVCLYDAIRPLGCDVMLIKSYHIISFHSVMLLDPLLRNMLDQNQNLLNW